MSCGPERGLGDMPDRNTEYLLLPDADRGMAGDGGAHAGVHAEGGARGQAADLVDGEQQRV